MLAFAAMKGKKYWHVSRNQKQQAAAVYMYSRRQYIKLRVARCTLRHWWLRANSGETRWLASLRCWDVIDHIAEARSLGLRSQPAIRYMQLQLSVYAGVDRLLYGRSYASAEYWIPSRDNLPVFACSAITPPKVNRFGLNLDHSEYIVGGWPWQILGSISPVARVWYSGEILFFFCRVNNARFRWFPVGNVSRNLNRTTAISVAVKNFRNRKFYRKGSFF